MRCREEKPLSALTRSREVPLLREVQSTALIGRAGGHFGGPLCSPLSLTELLLAPKSLQAENIFWGIHLCNVINYIYIMKFPQEFVCVM